MFAVEVHNLRKEFFRRDATRTRLRKTFTRRPGRADRRAGKAQRRSVAAVDDISFTMARGETIAVLGQNGSGKSTLVRILSTLLLHDGGEARVFGHDVRREAQAVRRLVNRVSVEASAGRMQALTPRTLRSDAPGLPEGVHVVRRVERLF